MMHPPLSGALAAGLGAMLVLAPAARAQPAPRVIPLATRPMDERLLGEGGPSPVSGHYLVGLQWGGTPRLFDPNAVGAVIPPSLAGRTVCVSLASEDGRYVARNVYHVPTDAIGAARFDTPTQYDKVLGAYPFESMAVLIREASTCDDIAAAPLLPATAHPPAPGAASTLTVFLNAEPQGIEVELRHGGQIVAVAPPCTTDPARTRIAYTTSCLLTLPAAAPRGDYALAVRKREHFAVSTTLYPLSSDWP